MCGEGVENELKYGKSNYLLYGHLVIFGPIMQIFLRSQSYDLDIIAHIGP